MSFLKQKRRLISSGLGLGSLFGFGSANAALPAAIGTGFTAVTTDFNTLINDNVWPLLITVALAFLIIKLFKKGVGAV